MHSTNFDQILIYSISFSQPSTPRQGLSRRNSCSTYSVSNGLASMLNERGIKAVTPSALNTPAGPNFSPTVTPCNSPEGTPPRENSPEPPLLTGLFYSGADMLRRKFTGASESAAERTSRLPARNKILLSRQEKRALRSLRLVEKVESIGLENIMHSSSHHHSVGISPLAMGSRSRNASPMTQLTSLKNISHQQRRGDDLYAVDRETIRAVLNKGLSHDSLNSDNLSTDGSTTSSITHHGDSSDTTMEKRLTHSANTATVNAAVAATTTTPPEAVRTPQKTDSRVKQMQRQKSRRSLMHGNGGQRPDLGTVGVARSDPVGPKARTSNSSSNKLGNTSTKQTQQFIDDDDQSSFASEAIVPQQTITQSFVGSISSLFFGRKGGLL